jgi:uncharacterized hydrophobic protein (TIGR00271 family)
MNIFSSIFSEIQKKQVISTIADEVALSWQYVILLTLSVVIATLGLLVNNSVIIIGAMILSPLMWPIIGLAMGTVASKRSLLHNSVILLSLSLVIILAVSFVIASFSPFSTFGSEVITRANPNLFDLGIALATGIAATLLILWPKYAESVAGVAVAASLLPPFAVTGIALSAGRYDYAWGSFLLFVTNLVSIIFAGIIIFSLGRFFIRERESDIRRRRIGFAVSTLIIIGLGVQLGFSLKGLVEQERMSAMIQQITTDFFVESVEGVVVTGVEARQTGEGSIRSVVSLQVPSGKVVTVAQKNALVTELDKAFKQDVTLSLRITSVSGAQEEVFDHVGVLRGQVEQLISEYLADNVSSKVQVDSLLLYELDDMYNAELSLQIPEGLAFLYEDRQELMIFLRSRLNERIDLSVRVATYEIVDRVAYTPVVQEVLRDLEQGFYAFVEQQTGLLVSSDLRLVYNLEEDTYTVTGTVDVPVSSDSFSQVEFYEQLSRYYTRYAIPFGKINWKIRFISVY